MIKKKGKSKAVAKKAARKKSSSRGKKEKETAEVRQDLTKLVKMSAEAMTAAVIDEGKKGQLPTLRYLLEMAGIFPVPEAEEKAPSKDEDSLAETLLDRLGIPKDPVVADRYEKDDEEIVMLPAKVGMEESSEKSDSEKHEEGVSVERARRS
jgi:hypothetical protein